MDSLITGLSDNFPPRPGCTTFPFEERRGLHDRFEGLSPPPFPNIQIQILALLITRVHSLRLV